jgi:hypothetical protein
MKFLRMARRWITSNSRLDEVNAAGYKLGFERGQMDRRAGRKLYYSANQLRDSAYWRGYDAGLMAREK